MNKIMNEKNFIINDVNYESQIREFLTSLPDICSLNNPGATKYCILFKFLTKNGWKMGGKQIFLGGTESQLETQLDELIKILNYQYITTQETYEIDDTGVMCIVFKKFTLKASQKREKAAEVLENVESTLSRPNILRDGMFNKIKLDQTLLDLGDIRDMFVSEKFMPFSTDVSKYGLYLKSIDGADIYLYNRKDNITLKHYDHAPEYTVEVFCEDVKLFTYFDTVSEDGSWTRTKNRIKLFFTGPSLATKEDKLIKVEGYYDLPYIPELKTEENTSTQMVFNVITLGFAAYKTRQGNNTIFEPFVAVIYDGKNKFTYHKRDYGSLDLMLKDIFNQLSEYNKYIVYIHNMSKLDITFMTNFLTQHYKLKPVIKEGKILTLKVTNKYRENQGSRKIKRQKKANFELRDSFLMLNAPLETAAKNFCIPLNCEPIALYPQDFWTEETLNYEGAMQEYRESKEYVTKDVVLLYDTLLKMHEQIQNNYGVGLMSSISLSSLSLKIFRSSRFFKNSENKIPILTGKVYNYIQKGYYGGFNEVYSTSMLGGYYVDVNSLYPSAMLNFMPTGQPVYTTEKDLNKLFGFVTAKIEAPAGIKNPILPHTLDDGRTILATGTMTGVYFSEELKNAVLYGYKVEVLSAITFTPDKSIFTDFVSHFYEIKKNKNHELYSISKLLLNSLYGRFGMKLDKEVAIIVNNVDLDYYFTYYKITDHIELNSNYSIIKFNSMPDLSMVKKANGSVEHYFVLLKDNKFDAPYINVAISAAISAYGRIRMSKYLIDSKYGLTYIDNDGMYLRNLYPDIPINEELGSFKLEHTVLMALFVAPKSYILVNDKYMIIKKFKGLNMALSFDEYINLYEGGTVIKLIQKWFNHNNTLIIIKNLNITLKRVIAKRLCTIINGVVTETHPIQVHNGQILPTTLVVKQPVPLPVPRPGDLITHKPPLTALIIYKHPAITRNKTDSLGKWVGTSPFCIAERSQRDLPAIIMQICLYIHPTATRILRIRVATLIIRPQYRVMIATEVAARLPRSQINTIAGGSRCDPPAIRVVTDKLAADFELIFIVAPNGDTVPRVGLKALLNTEPGRIYGSISFFLVIAECLIYGPISFVLIIEERVSPPHISPRLSNRGELHTRVLFEVHPIAHRLPRPDPPRIRDLGPTSVALNPEAPVRRIAGGSRCDPPAIIIIITIITITPIDSFLY